MILNSLLLILMEAANLAFMQKIAAVISASIVVIGAAWGISRIGSSALESISRQPEAAKNIQTSMILAAALIEGIAFFALVAAFIVIFV